MIKKKCLICNKEFITYPYDENVRKYCSFKCYWFARKNNSKYPGYWEGKKRLSMLGNKNVKWKGNNVGYVALHAWVRRLLGSPSRCDDCGNVEAIWYHWANKSGKYKRDVKDWIRLCVPCHSKLDHSRPFARKKGK